MNYPPNPLPCGCAVLGTPEINIEGTMMEHKNQHVKHCALHAAAPALLKACKLAIEEFKHLGQAMGEYAQPEMVAAWNEAEKAIAEAGIQKE